MARDELKVGGRVYSIFRFLRKGKVWIQDETLRERARQLRASGDDEHCQFILEHQSDIPVELRGRVKFLFPETAYGVDNAIVFTLIHWDSRKRKWVRFLEWLDFQGRYNDDNSRLVRLRQPH